ncbi:MAG: cytochrome b subunit of the bc complex [Chloroflexota bacterium]
MATTHPEEEKDSVPFFPNHFMTEFYVVVGITVLAVVIGALGMMFPVGLQDPADPLNTPLHVKPEWYFLALYQLLKFVPPSILGINGPMFAVVSIILALLVVAIWPFLDQKADSKKAMRIRAIGVAVFVVLAIALTIWGEVS